MIPALLDLENWIKARYPKFKVRFKDESLFMKFLGVLMFFNPNFMNRFITTIGNTIYFPNKYDYNLKPWLSFNILCHELMHVVDYNKSPIKFLFGYTFPQNLSVLSVFALLSFISPWFLFFLVTLGFLAPIPSPFRRDIEIRGYQMSYLLDKEQGVIEPGLSSLLNYYANQFTNSSYYFMSRDSNYCRSRILDVEGLKDQYPYKDVLNIYKKYYNEGEE